MCYSNCPGENWEGACVRPSIQGTPAAHCFEEGEEEGEKQDEQSPSREGAQPEATT